MYRKCYVAKLVEDELEADLQMLSPFGWIRTGFVYNWNIRARLIDCHWFSPVLNYTATRNS